MTEYIKSVMTPDGLVITIRIKSCSQCRHLDHSGAFTPGGAQYTCEHKSAPDPKGNSHWKYRVVNKKNPTQLPKEFPDWCPLISGHGY